ncbi:helix-turn-helix domain-containing protein [Poritiphilus flavus]|uniref:Helix-turn-helix domain-containing protein n=1 Tax=Poritiphilus flavus TaxID=2697053 RepID=A0A6L9E8Y3_9FLAO|nr:helix-turn-helix domain-containing protein [Poritiphilus flavus]NAS11176.1 helix-turn-helix domain-containing protein [Poritiphilus flavus]
MGRVRLVLLFLFYVGYGYPIAPIGNADYFGESFQNNIQSLAEADLIQPPVVNKKPVPSLKAALPGASGDSAKIYRNMALSAASLGKASEAADHIERYFLKEFNTSFLYSEGFTTIQKAPEFKEVIRKYTPKINGWALVYLYVAFVGFYIAVVINFNRKIDFVARILISLFVFIHSFFIFHICLLITNYQYEFPHSYLMSTVFIFLYGPLLYFYFKRITQQHKFKKIDLLHLLPTVLFLFYILPIYALPADDKLQLMLERTIAGYNPGDSSYLVILVSLKLLSLGIYAFFIRKLYLKSKQEQELPTENRIWQRNIYFIHVFYIITYAVYGTLITNHINSGFFYHMQVISMALMVLYIGYSANVQPNVFSGTFAYKNPLFFKYKKSGLTSSLSIELKDQLIALFEMEKIYKESDISLELLASRLNTTRHNASQVINEHFEMSFHELINKYRIEEAKKILDSDRKKNLNIIDIAYEVGYNNKVTFNKAFKKDTQLTPSEYQKIYVRS